jgi:DNA replication protein DnaC
MRYGTIEEEDELVAPRAVRNTYERHAIAIEKRPHPTRDLRDIPMPVTTLPTWQLPQQALLAHTQQIKQNNRVTQPLHNSQITVETKHKRALQQAIDHLRAQTVPREQSRAPERRSAQALIPAASCSKCRGAGYLRVDVPFGHPNFGKPIACECKEVERKEKRRQQLREMSNLDAFHKQTFQTFNARVAGAQEAYRIASGYAHNPHGWLLLIGPNGCGKTHLAAAIANSCLDNGSVVLFAVVPDLLDHLRAAFAPNAPELYDQLFAKMREAEVLVLDDMGAQQSSPWANEKLFQLLNYRYNLGMPTVITANPRGLQGIDERIRSRLSDVSLVVTLNLERMRDYRPNHPGQR